MYPKFEAKVKPTGDEMFEVMTPVVKFWGDGILTQKFGRAGWRNTEVIESTTSPPTTVSAFEATPNPLARVHSKPPVTVRDWATDASAVKLMDEPVVDV